VRELGAFVKPGGKVGGGNEILGESAVDTVACVAPTLAECLPAGLAIFARLPKAFWFIDRIPVEEPSCDAKADGT
jgi:hypothetical protein